MTDMTRREFGVTALGGLAAARPGQREAGTGAGGDAARPYPDVHLDGFTDRRRARNQLLVYTSPTGLDTESMQGLTRESNYSENTFVFPPEHAGTDFRVRIFTRTAETPFAGHPTIGTAFALAHTGALRPGTARTMFQLVVGPTPLDLALKDGRLAFAWMTPQKRNFGKTIADRAALAAALGLEPQYVDPRAPAQEVYSGSTFFIVPLATRKAVDGAVLDRTKIDALFTA